MSYRNLDVDVYEEGSFAAEEDENDQKPETNLALQKQIQEKAAEIRTKLNSGHVKDAIILGTSAPILGIKAPQLKDLQAHSLLEALQRVKSTEIPSILESLSSDQIDCLMKFVYHGMSEPDKFNCSILLQWHNEIVTIAGLGTIIRVMTNRKPV